MTFEAIEILADPHTTETASNKALEMGCALVHEGMVRKERTKQTDLFLEWLVHCAIPFRLVEARQHTVRHPERMATAIRIATEGRRAFSID